MFSINDYVFYGTAGVCQITEIKPENFSGSQQDYYVLKPLHANSITYVSTTNETHLAKMRPVLTKSEIIDLIQCMPAIKIAWIKNDSERRLAFVEKLGSGKCRDLVSLAKALYLEKARKKDAGKRLSSSDLQIMSAAEKLLYEEFAFVLQINPDEVPTYIMERVTGETH